MSQAKRNAGAEAAITDIPCDTIIYAFFYLEPSDLFYAIPLVCRRFRESLHKICNKSSGNSFIDNFSRTTENILWKALYRKIAPSIDKIVDDQLFCYRKMFAYRFLIRKPLWHQLNKLSQIRNIYTTETTQFPQKTLDDFEVLANVTRLIDTFGTIVSDLENIRTDMVASQLDKTNHKLKEFQFYGYEHFFDDTCRVFTKQTDPDIMFSDTLATWSYEGKLKIISPLNGKSATITIEIIEDCMLNDFVAQYVRNEANSISICLHELGPVNTQEQKTKLYFVRQMRRNAANQVSLTLWKVITHLGLDILEEKENQYKIIQEFWDQVITTYLLNHERHKEIIYMDSFELRVEQDFYDEHKERYDNPWDDPANQTPEDPTI
jgi:hypothetical protein